MLDNKSKIFFTVLAFLVLTSLAVTYYKYVVLEDFTIFTDEELFNEALLEE
jgi:hypothetical protein